MRVMHMQTHPKHIQSATFSPPEKEGALFCAFALDNAPSHFTKVLFVPSAALLPARAASSTHLLLLLFWPG